MGKKSKANRKKAPVATPIATATVAVATPTAAETTTTATGTIIRTGATVLAEFSESTFFADGESFHKKGNQSKAKKKPELSSHSECPICYHRLPFDADEHVYHPCCGQLLCYGCVIGKQRTQLKELGKIVEGTTLEEEQFRLIEKHGNIIYTCPYCRTPPPDEDQELLQRIYDRVEICNDRDYTIALNQLGSHYENGQRGLPQNLTKAEEFYKKAYDLDDPDAAWNLFVLYHDYYHDKKEQERKCLLRGEMLGNLECTQVLAKRAYCDSERAYLYCDYGNNMENFVRLCVKSVRLGGGTDNMNDLWWCYRENLLSKDVVATTLRANQALKDEVTTKRRDFANRYKQFCDAS